MEIQSLAVKGFRSLAEVEWLPGNLNILIGPNSSGKSNLLRALEMLRASARGELAKFVQREGGMEPMVWDGSAESVEVNLQGRNRDTGADVQRADYLVMLKRSGKSATYQIGTERLSIETDGLPGSVTTLERTALAATLKSFGSIRELTGKELTSTETVVSLISSPFEEHLLANSFREELASWMIHPRVNLDAMRGAPVVSFEEDLEADSSNLIPVLHTAYTGDRDFKEDIDSAMRAAFGTEFQEIVFPPAADQRIQMRVRWRSLRRAQSGADLSDGTLRFLFLLVALRKARASSVIAIDEPETGLHPSMLSIVAEFAAEAARRTQVILTTHSPSMLDALAPHHATVTVTQWTEGRTTLKQMSQDDLAYWLDKYSLGELYRSGQLESVD